MSNVRTPSRGRGGAPSNTSRSESQSSRNTSSSGKKFYGPPEFSNGNPCYMMDARHSGDMYHFRAAMAVQPQALFLWKCNMTGTDRKLQELQHYLSYMAKHKGKDWLLAPVDKNVIELKAPPTTPADLTGWKLNGEPFKDLKQTLEPIRTRINEGNSTTIIRDAVVKDAAPVDVVKNAMALVTLSATQKQELEKKFEKLSMSQELEAKKANPGVFIQHRSSGLHGGVYPEMDTGGALKELADMVKSLSHRPIIVGSNELKVQGIASLGEYWIVLKAKQEDGKSFAEHYDVPQRDIEAFYFDWAYRKRYYSMVIGFRSGMVDLFTFLSIPTVSIGWIKLPGEDRHKKLDLPVFKRTMIQYENARFDETARPPHEPSGFLKNDPALVKSGIEKALKNYPLPK